MVRLGPVVLVGGLILLGVGVAVALDRHNRAVDRREAERARYELALQRAAEEAPRFAVSYVRAPLTTVRRLARGEYAVVGTDVARRIATDRPTLHPDFAKLAATESGGSALAFRERVATDETVHVVALLVTQKTPGNSRLRLEFARLSLDTFADIWDPLDLLTVRDSFSSIFRRKGLGRRSAGAVSWTPRVGRTAVVPLSLLHVFNIPRTPANRDVISALGGVLVIQVATGDVLAPRRLVLHGSDGRNVEIRLGRALHPLVLAAGA